MARSKAIALGLGCGSMGLLLAGSSMALGLSPMRLETRRGQLQVSNTSDRLMRVELQVFPERQVQGRPTAALTPLPAAEAEALIRLRPSVFRLGPGASRVIPYSVGTANQTFYVCGTSLQSLLHVRICSRWLSGASASGRKSP
jgi:hypothetical protein